MSDADLLRKSSRSSTAALLAAIVALAVALLNLHYRATTDHPATLTTEADFAAAPIGTVVLHPWGAAVKRGEDSWGVTGNDMRRRDDTVGDLDEEEPLTVLRWGPGEAEQ